MMPTKFEHFKNAHAEIPKHQPTWPLFGTGLESLGLNGKPVQAEVEGFSAHELLMRIDAVSLCFTDVKEIDQGQSHPRLTDRDLKKRPIIPGHEVSMTVVGVGDALKSDYKIGQRFTLQPDVWVDGKSIPFCFDMDGGYRQYARIGSEILSGDAGNYLIPIPDSMTYAASAITEPWACVEAAYRAVYRDAVKNNGNLLFVGCPQSRDGYKLGELVSHNHIPSEIMVCEVPARFKQQVSDLCKQKAISYKEVTAAELAGADFKFDDIVTLDLPAAEITALSVRMKTFAVLCVMQAVNTEERMEIDLGRLHYDNIFFVGSSGLNIETAYAGTKPRVELTPSGTAWFFGAGGPMGRMHLQRAIEDPAGPTTILASEITEDRFLALSDFLDLAHINKKELILLNPKTDPQYYSQTLQKLTEKGGADDIVMLVAVPSIVEELMEYLAVGGVMNLFAGLKKGIAAKINPWFLAGPQHVRFNGHSGSGLDDQKEVVKRAIKGSLKPEMSVAAIGGINQIANGIQAMKDNTYPGKIVIFPHVPDFPLTALKELQSSVPSAFAELGEGYTWSLKAEQMFLEKMLL